MRSETWERPRERLQVEGPERLSLEELLALVLRTGAAGCSVLDGDVPADIDDAMTINGLEVVVVNVLGAGDAFLSGFLYG